MEKEKKTYSNPRMELTINDWPFGFREKAIAHFHIEQSKKGERAVRMIKSATTGEVYKPKKLTYAAKARIVDGSDGKTYIAELTQYGGFISIMRGDMKIQEESIFDRDPRFDSLKQLFF